MEPFRLHLYVCEQRKAEGAPCCSARGSLEVIAALRKEVAKAGLGDVQITTCGSLGLCTRGPNMVVYPDGVWYSGVGVADVPEIVEQHLRGGKVVERLVNHEARALRVEIEGNKKKALAARAAADAAGVLPDEFNQQVRGFQPSRVLLTAIELDIFSAVGDGRSADAIAADLGTAPRATAMLLDALVALGTLRKQDGSYRNTPLSSRYLAANAPDDARAALGHTAELWPRWSTLTDCVRKGTSVTYTEMVNRDDNWTTTFIAAMHRNAAARAPLVVKTVAADSAHRMLDVGGGSGAYSIAFARANPELHAEILDLPTVLPIARGNIEEAGLADRISTRAGDLREDELGSGYDLIMLSAICHMLGPDGVRSLLGRCFAALAPGGQVVIQDFILEPDRTSPRSAALFALNMLVGTPDGGTYTADEYQQWLRQAGCVEVRHVRLRGPTGLVIGQRG